jgi:hypothetical protein
MTKLILVAAIGALALGCHAKKSTPTSIPLTDPETGRVVGHKNQTTGALVFDNGAVVERSRINSLVDRDLAQRLLSNATAYLKKPKTAASGGIHGSSGGDNTSCGGCAGGCWSMSEGGSSCTGCCTPAGDCSCACWESCTDKQSSSSSGPAK